MSYLKSLAQKRDVLHARFLIVRAYMIGARRLEPMLMVPVSRAIFGNCELNLSTGLTTAAGVSLVEEPNTV